MVGSHVTKTALSLLRPVWGPVLFYAIAGLAGGIGASLSIALINKLIYAQSEDTATLLSLTFITIIIAIMGRFISDIGTNIIGQTLVSILRTRLALTLLNAPTLSVEKLKKEKVITSISGDLKTLSDFAFNMSIVLIDISIVLGGFCYILIDSPIIGLTAFGLVTGTMILSMRIHRSAMAEYSEARTAFDHLHKRLESIVHGAKELKLNRARRTTIAADIDLFAVSKIKTHNIRARKIFSYVTLAHGICFYTTILISIALGFILNKNAEAISSVVFVLLYLRSSLEQIFAYLPLSAGAKVAADRVARLEGDLRSIDLETDSDASNPSPDETAQTIELRNITFCYPDNTNFNFGPMTITIDPGKLYYVIGENGSGKTTFIKLLLGLYPPNTGYIVYGGQRINGHNRDHYRQIFSTVFTDYDLGSAPPVKGIEDRDRLTTFLTKVYLPQTILDRQGQLNPALLSTGQKKRLALVLAIMENRPILVFDEWAAEQDPYFKDLFYNDVLPSLQEMGKTVIAITHDDRYFHRAERIIALKDGRLDAARSYALSMNAVKSDSCAG